MIEDFLALRAPLDRRERRWVLEGLGGLGGNHGGGGRVGLGTLLWGEGIDMGATQEGDLVEQGQLLSRVFQEHLVPLVLEGPPVSL